MVYRGYNDINHPSNGLTRSHLEVIHSRYLKPRYQRWMKVFFINAIKRCNMSKKRDLLSRFPDLFNLVGISCTGNVVYWSPDHREVYVELLLWDRKALVELSLKTKEQTVMVGARERLHKPHAHWNTLCRENTPFNCFVKRYKAAR